MRLLIWKKKSDFKRNLERKIEVLSARLIQYDQLDISISSGLCHSKKFYCTFSQLVENYSEGAKYLKLKDCLMSIDNLSWDHLLMSLEWGVVA